MLYQTTCSTQITVGPKSVLTLQWRTRPVITGGGGGGLNGDVGFSVHDSYDKNYVARMCFTRPHALRKLQLDLNQY